MKHIHPFPSFALDCENISFISDGGTILRSQDFTLSQNEKVLIEGPSGSGKTTFMKIISWLILPSTGSVQYSSGKNCWNTSSKKFSDFRRANISMAFAEPLFFDTLTVEQNLLFPHFFLHLAYKDSWKDELLNKLWMNEFLGVKVSQLSSGEKDRINIIRALLYESPILFLDEPGAHMDHELFGTFLSILSDYLERVQPLTLIISHSDKFSDIVDRNYICENWLLITQK